MNRLSSLLPGRWGLHIEAGVYRVADLRGRRWLGAWSEPQDAAQALEAHIAPVWRRDTVDVVFADVYSRPAALPRPRGIRGLGELHAAHRGRFDAMFGADERWRLCVQPQSAVSMEHEAIDVVVGAPEGTLAPIERLCGALRWRLRTLRPQWLAWADRWSDLWRDGEHWLVVADGVSTTLAYMVEGRCVSVRQQRGSALPLADLLAREAALVPHGHQEASVWVAGLGRTSDFGQAPRVVSAEDWWTLGTAANDSTTAIDAMKASPVAFDAHGANP